MNSLSPPLLCFLSSVQTTMDLQSVSIIIILLNIQFIAKNVQCVILLHTKYLFIDICKMFTSMSSIFFDIFQDSQSKHFAFLKNFSHHTHFFHSLIPTFSAKCDKGRKEMGWELLGLWKQRENALKYLKVAKSPWKGMKPVNEAVHIWM